ncbi:hypothetical protein AJ79_09443 [Helicocarpus griseus UAMH5409]|uniref:C2H2 type master regulator of conidiophore development brlA n=1 Tax=Helicocarpus griseus UAMH5409 TaxID=1447875 RepID=A0A2B7WJT1_9EURO|nr:hypothetical protein AJ79_09443 [Helicocarpus griseus UAMH5409]
MNARRAGMSGFVSEKSVSRNLKAPEQRAYVKQESVQQLEAPMGPYPGTPDMHGFWHRSPHGAHDGTVVEPELGSMGMLRGHSQNIRGEHLQQHMTSHTRQTGHACYELGYQDVPHSVKSSPYNLETPGGAWRRPLAEVEPALAGFSSGMGGLVNTPMCETPYAEMGMPKQVPQMDGSGESLWGYDNSGYYPSQTAFADPGQPAQKSPKQQSGQTNPRRRRSIGIDGLPSRVPAAPFHCDEPGCEGKFKRQEHLKRHQKSHTKEKPYVCWVPDCAKSFSRNDNLKVHYTTTHGKKGGRNRYVATLDHRHPEYNMSFRGELTPDGRPIHSSKTGGEGGRHPAMQ